MENNVFYKNMRTVPRIILRACESSYMSNSRGKPSNYFATYPILRKDGLRQKHRQVTNMFAQQIED